MNHERLKKAIKILEKVPQRYFDMEIWGETFDLGEDQDRVLKPECGTHGCAMGWIASDPEMRMEGLKLERDQDSNESNQVHLCPVYQGIRGFGAAAAFFDISLLTADYIFSRSSYPFEEFEDEGRFRDRPVRVQQVIERIEQVLQESPR